MREWERERERDRDGKRSITTREKTSRDRSAASLVFSLFLGTIHTDTQHELSLCVCVRVCIVLWASFSAWYGGTGALPRTCGVYAYNESITIRTCSKVVIILRLMHLVTSLNKIPNDSCYIVWRMFIHFPIDSRAYIFIYIYIFCV